MTSEGRRRWYAASREIETASFHLQIKERGFEFHLTFRPINKIKHLARQIAAKSSKIYANLQPAATRLSTLILVLIGLMKMHKT